LLFRRWPRLGIDRLISSVKASPTVTDDKGYVNIAELCQLVGLVDQGDFLLLNLSLLLLGALIAIIRAIILHKTRE